MKTSVGGKRLLLAIILPFLFFVLNYIVLKITFNPIEFCMITFCSFYSVIIYEKNHDYLDPRLYFPILYSLFYWLGDFNMILYKQVPFYLWWYYLVGLIAYVIGAEISQRSTRVNIAKYNKEKDRDYLSKNAKNIIFVIYIIAICAKLYMFKTNGIPLFASNIDASRQTMSENFGIIKAITYVITVIPVFAFYDLIIRKTKKKKIPIIDIFIIGLSIVICVLDVSRLLLIQMGLPMLVIYILKVKRISLKQVAVLVAIAFVYIGLNQIMRNIRLDSNYLSYIATTRSTNFFENIMISCFNNFRVGIDDFYKIVEIVPSQSGYTYGKLFMNSILSPLPGKQVTIGYYVSNLLGMSFDGIGAASTILGMFYLDGGIILIFVGMMLLGMFIQYFYKKYIMKNTMTIYHLVAVYVFFYSINTLRTNVMPTIEPLMGMFYYCFFSYVIKRFK